MTVVSLISCSNSSSEQWHWQLNTKNFQIKSLPIVRTCLVWNIHRKSTAASHRSEKHTDTCFSFFPDQYEAAVYFLWIFHIKSLLIKAGWKTFNVKHSQEVLPSAPHWWGEAGAISSGVFAADTSCLFNRSWVYWRRLSERREFKPTERSGDKNQRFVPLNQKHEKPSASVKRRQRQTFPNRIKSSWTTTSERQEEELRLHLTSNQ